MSLLDNIRGIGELTLKGLVAVNAPTILKGILIEFLRQQHHWPDGTIHPISVDNLIDMVLQNKSLWSILPPEHYDKMRAVAAQVGDVDWLTTDWMINAIKKDHPAVASLFLGWKKGRNWLDRQLKEIKGELQ